MYNPISLNVIRNSFNLCGVPQPMHIKSLDQVRFPSDTIVTAYRMIFAANRVIAYMSEYAPLSTEGSFSLFVRWLNDCFCADIFTTDWDYDDYDDTLSVTLCTRWMQHESAAL